MFKRFLTFLIFLLLCMSLLFHLQESFVIEQTEVATTVKAGKVRNVNILKIKKQISEGKLSNKKAMFFYLEQ